MCSSQRRSLAGENGVSHVLVIMGAVVKKKKKNNNNKGSN
jgi:hypothetical protein